MLAATEKEMQLLSRAAAEFARDVLVPDRESHDRFPFGPSFEEIAEKAFQLDFFHLMLPEDLDGTGMGITALCRLLDEVAREDPSLAAMILTTNTAHSILMAAEAIPLLRKLTRRAKPVQEFLIAFPTFSNPSEIVPRVFAAEFDGQYRLNGEVAYLVLGSMAHYGLVPAVVDHNSKYAWFGIDLKDPSVHISEPILSLGVHACPAVDVTLEDSACQPVGDIAQGAAYFSAGTAVMHLAAAGISTGIMKGALAAALAYCKQREQGGRKIIDWSELQMLLADMTERAEVADMLLAQACHAAERQEKKWETKVLAAAVHIQASAAQVTTDGVQALGGVGYMKAFGQEKRMRDAKHIQASLGLAPLKKLNILRQKL